MVVHQSLLHECDEAPVGGRAGSTVYLPVQPVARVARNRDLVLLLEVGLLEDGYVDPPVRECLDKREPPAPPAVEVQLEDS